VCRCVVCSWIPFPHRRNRNLQKTRVFSFFLFYCTRNRNQLHTTHYTPLYLYTEYQHPVYYSGGGLEETLPQTILFLDSEIESFENLQSFVSRPKIEYMMYVCVFRTHICILFFAALSQWRSVANIVSGSYQGESSNTQLFPSGGGDRRRLFPIRRWRLFPIRRREYCQWQLSRRF